MIFVVFCMPTFAVCIIGCCEAIIYVVCLNAEFFVLSVCLTVVEANSSTTSTSTAPTTAPKDAMASTKPPETITKVAAPESASSARYEAQNVVRHILKPFFRGCDGETNHYFSFTRHAYYYPYIHAHVYSSRTCNSPSSDPSAYFFV